MILAGNNEKKYFGIAASPGIIIGKVNSLSFESEVIAREAIENPEEEIQTFRSAIGNVKRSLDRTADKILERLGPEFARIFEAQAMIADDQVWNSTIEKRIREEGICAEYIYFDEARKVTKQLGNSDDAYLRERMQDIESVTAKLVSRLKGEKHTALRGFKGATVVTARYIHPGDILALSIRRNLGFATGIGGPTSHLALMAKSLSVPAVIGLGDIAEKLETGSRVILDGYKGILIVNPAPSTRKYYRELRQSEIHLRRQLGQLKSKPAITRDKKEIGIMANIELPNEVPKVIAAGASGIGLYRTEYLFLTKPDFPSFEEQYKTYSSILRKMGNRPVVIRTFDLGGDKFPGVARKKFDLNPFLGWRAIRVCLDRPELFKIQLKALLKASRYGNLSIMIPMISNYEELMETRRIFEESKAELRKEKVKFKENIPLGIMIEVPSAVLIAEFLAKKADFFSIGTNDLIQYTVAVDRGNELLSKLYQSFHPAVLGLVKKSIDAAHSKNVEVSVCGEMAADPLGAVLLAGLGVDTLSVSFQYVGTLKKIIRTIDYENARLMARKALKMKSEREIISYVEKESVKRFPDLENILTFSRRNANG
jgi:phosphotransferase system enzyme I (PtsI)